MYPGYLRVVVEALIIVETIELVYANVGWVNLSLSVAIRVKALLSITTVASALRTNLFIARRQLYGWTTTSFSFGKTLYVYISFLGNLSFNLSSRNDPKPDPVPPAVEWVMTKPSRESEPSASLSIMSMMSS
jgi:hypothetical protein